MLSSLGREQLICAFIYLALTRLHETHVSNGDHPHADELSVSGENASGDNENITLLAFLGSLAGRGDVSQAEINLTSVGHTHVFIDSVFIRCVSF